LKRVKEFNSQNKLNQQSNEQGNDVCVFLKQ